MTAALKQKADALVAELRLAEVVELADLLYTSLPVDFRATVDKALQTDVDQRLDNYESGQAEVIDAEDSIARARQALSEIRRTPLRSKP